MMTTTLFGTRKAVPLDICDPVNSCADRPRADILRMVLPSVPLARRRF
jgi:hypothetical protein